MFDGLFGSKRKWGKVAVLAVLSVAAPSVFASYTVIDDDLLPATFAVALPPMHYAVPFARNSSQITAAAGAVLISSLALPPGATIRIIGRPDAVIYSKGTLSELPASRAKALFNYLTSRGVPSTAITIEVDPTPNQQSGKNIFPCDMYVTKTDVRTVAPFVTTTVAGQRNNNYPQANAPVMAAPSAIGQPVSVASQGRMIEYINQAVKSGQMAPTVALALIKTMLEAVPSTSPQLRLSEASNGRQPPQIPDAPAPVVTPYAAPKVQPLPIAPQATSWRLDKNLNLRDNIDAWANHEGWKNAQWDASNLFQITTSTTVSGDFPGVLQQIADSTGLNICVNKHEKTIHVTDSSTSCK